LVGFPAAQDIPGSNHETGEIMIDMLHWVAQSDQAELERAMPVFVAAFFAALGQLGVMLSFASNCKRR